MCRWVISSVFVCYLTTITLIIFLLRCFLKLIHAPCKSKVCLIGKTAIITGGNRGIGYETSLGLAARGCKVIIACRGNADKVREDIINRTHNPNVVTKYLDLNSLDSVREFCKEIHETEEKIDILINNAGILVEDNAYTKDGLHPTMQTNVFGPFLLTHLLVDLLKKAEHGRIIFVSSIMAFFNNLTVENLNGDKNKKLTYLSTATTYANSKLCQIIVSNEFAENLKPFGITSNSLHPGIVLSGLFDKLFVLNPRAFFLDKLFFLLILLMGRNPEEGAQRTLKLAMSNKYRNVTGGFFWFTTFAPTAAKNKDFRRNIWRQIEKHVKLREDEKIEGAENDVDNILKN